MTQKRKQRKVSKKKPGPKPNPQVAQAVAELMDQRMPRGEIVRTVTLEHGCNESTVYRAIDRYFDNNQEQRERRRLHLLKSLDHVWTQALAKEKFSCLPGIANQIAKVEGFHAPENHNLNHKAEVDMELSPQAMARLLREFQQKKAG